MLREAFNQFGDSGLLEIQGISPATSLLCGLVGGLVGGLGFRSSLYLDTGRRKPLTCVKGVEHWVGPMLVGVVWGLLGFLWNDWGAASTVISAHLLVYLILYAKASGKPGKMNEEQERPED